MTKGNGDYPAVSEFSPEEVSNIRKITTFFLNYSPWNAENDITDVVIEECKVIYDGITYSAEMECGLCIKKDELEGHPSPIIEFTLSRPVEMEDFRKCVWMSSFLVSPSTRNNSGQEPFFFEDHNGYTSAIENVALIEIIESYKKNKLFSGKVFSREAMEAGIPCLEMLG
jgi:hypothetical protein